MFKSERNYVLYIQYMRMRGDCQPHTIKFQILMLKSQARNSGEGRFVKSGTEQPALYGDAPHGQVLTVSEIASSSSAS